MTEWQDISTAPKDGTAILAVNSNRDRAVVRWGHLDGERMGWVPVFASVEVAFRMWNDGGDGYWNGRATHWQPLPPPPATDSDGDDGA